MARPILTSYGYVFLPGKPIELRILISNPQRPAQLYPSLPGAEGARALAREASRPTRGFSKERACIINNSFKSSQDSGNRPGEGNIFKNFWGIK